MREEIAERRFSLGTENALEGSRNIVKSLRIAAFAALDELRHTIDNLLGVLVASITSYYNAA